LIENKKDVTSYLQKLERKARQEGCKYSDSWISKRVVQQSLNQIWIEEYLIFIHDIVRAGNAMLF